MERSDQSYSVLTNVLQCYAQSKSECSMRCLTQPMSASTIVSSSEGASGRLTPNSIPSQPTTSLHFWHNDGSTSLLDAKQHGMVISLTIFNPSNISTASYSSTASNEYIHGHCKSNQDFSKRTCCTLSATIERIAGIDHTTARHNHVGASTGHIHLLDTQ